MKAIRDSWSNIIICLLEILVEFENRFPPIMEKMRPALEKAQKQCGSNRELLMQKQRAIYKEYKYSMFGSCLPMIVTMVVFFIVFGGYNAAVAKYGAEKYGET